MYCHNNSIAILTTLIAAKKSCTYDRRVQTWALSSFDFCWRSSFYQQTTREADDKGTINSCCGRTANAWTLKTQVGPASCWMATAYRCDLQHATVCSLIRRRSQYNRDLRQRGGFCRIWNARKILRLLPTDSYGRNADHWVGEEAMGLR